MHILVIEDFQLLRDSICQGLREAGFAVDSAADGETGLWQAQSCQYDAIILDLMLPRLDGMSVMRKLRQSGSKVHILILTAKDSPPDRIGGLDAGADDYLVKPFDFGELLARVRALVRREYGSKNPLLTIADLEIDTINRVVRRTGKTVNLTPREFGLLQFLAIRQGQLVTRSEIWEHVYEFDSDAGSNVVDVFIGHLRRKIDVSGSVPLIHTRRGHGYMLGTQP